MTDLSEDCSLKSAWAFSASFQKSGLEVIWFSSATRFCLVSTSKTPPQKIEPLFEVGQLFGGFFQHRISRIIQFGKNIIA
jgi:hypothetical protein